MKKLIIMALSAILSVSSCVKDKVSEEVLMSSITNIVYTPEAVTESDDVTVTANVTYNMGSVTNVVLLYWVNGTDMTASDMALTSGDTYEASIPAQADGAVVTFAIQATNSEGYVTTTGTLAYTVGAVPPNYAAIRINEIDGNTKFVELYNTTADPVDISGMRIIKNGTSLKNPTKTEDWAVPSGTTLQGNSFAVIKCDKYSASAPANTIIGEVGDGMSAKQTLQLQLLPPTGTTVIDEFLRQTTPASALGTEVNSIPGSFCRIPDGSGAWKTDTATPGTANPSTGGSEITTTLP